MAKPQSRDGWLRRRLTRPLLAATVTHHAARLSDGTILHYRACGAPDAPPIVLIHGVGITAVYFEALMRGLATCGLRALAPDLPGFGGSPMLADRKRATVIGDLTDMLAAWLEQEVGRAHIVGHSGGCQQAGDLAVRYPHLVDHLIFTSLAPGGSHGDMLRSTLGFAVDLFIETPEISWLAFSNYCRAGPHRMIEMMLAYAAYDLDRDLPRITQPTLIIWGDRDPIASISYAPRALRRLPDARMAVIKNSSHCVIYHTWRETCAVIIAFLGMPLAPGIRVAEAELQKSDGAPFSHQAHTVAAKIV